MQINRPKSTNTTMNKKEKRILYLIGAFTFFLFYAGSSSSQEGVLTFESAVQEALVKNPEILAAKEKYKASLARIPQELTPEDPMLEFSYDEMRSGIMDYMGKPMRSYAVSQKMPFPTKLLLRGRIAHKDSRISYESYRDKERDIVAR